MTIYFYKGLIRNPEILNIWRPGQVRNTKLDTDVSNEMLLNAGKCQAFTLFELLRENQQAGKITPPPHLPPPRLGLKSSYREKGLLVFSYFLMPRFSISLHKKMKFSIKDFFSKCDQIRSVLRIWSHLLQKSLMENFIFLTVY